MRLLEEARGVPEASPPRPQPAPALPPLASHGLAALAYAALTLLFLRPAWRLLGTHLSPDPGDPLFLLYVLKWGIHQLRLGLPDLWDAPFFFPSRATLTYSDHLLGPAALGFLLSPLLPNPILFYNLLFLGSFAASGWTAWYVLKRSGLPSAAAFLGGAMFAFSPFRWAQASHLQILLAAWIPLTLWTWDRLLARPGGRRAAAFLACYVPHVTGGTYLAYMIHVSLAAIAAVRLPPLVSAVRREPGRRREIAWVAGAALAGGLVTLAVFLPYLHTARALGLARSPREMQFWGAALPSYFTPSPYNLYAGLFPARWHRAENELFAGVLPTALALGAFASGLRRTRLRPPARPLSAGRRAVLLVLALLALAGWLRGEWRTLAAADLLPHLKRPGAHYESSLLLLLCGALALGLRRSWGGNGPLDLSRLAPDPWPRGLALSGLACFLLSFPIAFQPLSRVLPGLSGMRVPARFYPLVSFPLCCLAARTLAALLARPRAPARRGLAAAGVGALLLLDLSPRPLPWIPVRAEPDFPPVYAWLATRPDVRAILELPMTGYTGEIRSMYYGTRHWKPLVNGYSGYLPPLYEEIRGSLGAGLPGRELIERLRGLGVTHLLVHRRPLRGLGSRRELRAWEAGAPLRLQYAVQGNRVYRLEPRPPSAEAAGPRQRAGPASDRVAGDMLRLHAPAGGSP